MSELMYIAVVAAAVAGAIKGIIKALRDEGIIQ